MGITGLLPQLKPIQNPVSLHRYEGQTLGIDGYAWLHRAACSCAMELALNKPTSKYLEFFIKKIGMLKSFKIEPYFVFDGDSIGVKRDTNDKRRTKRMESRAIAQRLWTSGERRSAMDYFFKSVDITPEMAKCIMDYCKVNGIAYIVAPFEADAQMVYLEKKGIIQGIISEDSDLLIFGCRRLITKLNDFGECIEICRDDFGKLPKKFPMNQLNGVETRTMVCLSGCDYTNGIPKVGLITAMKLVIKHRSLDKILLHIQREGKLKVPEEFIEEYQLADFAFQYQRVFCPIINKMTTLNDIPKHLLDCKALYACIGDVVDKNDGVRKSVCNSDEIDHDLHQKISRGYLNPYSRKLLVNREHKLQLSSKSDLHTIDNFFRMEPKRSNILQPKLSLTKTIDKLDSTIKRRRLNQESTVQLLKSKFFKEASESPIVTPATTPSLTPPTITPISTQEDIETDVPESQLPTQIPSSFDLLQADEEYLSEVLSELDDEIKMEKPPNDLDKIGSIAHDSPIAIDCPQKVTGSTIALQQFRYSSRRIPLKPKDINNKSDLNIQVPTNKNSASKFTPITTLLDKTEPCRNYSTNIVVRARATSQEIKDHHEQAQRPAMRTSLSAKFTYKPT